MDAKRVEHHEGAVADVKSAVAWPRKRSHKAVLNFVAELDRAVNTILRGTDRWASGNSNTRRFLLCRFPFTVVYSEQELTIIIWAVAHGSKRPEYWARRL